jgi:hypothetical protein
VTFSTSRLGLLLDQLDHAHRSAQQRFAGLTDEEYLWEPVPGCWSVRRRGESPAPDAFGPGAWLLDFDRRPPQPPPFTTIAWRLGHITSGLAGRWEWTFGGRAADPAALVDFPPTADAALQAYEDWIGRWEAGVRSLTDDQLDQVGFGQYPWGLDPTVPFISIVWWVNQELIHHQAEIALLRDLWRAEHP